jgi:hypothetical protein
MTIAQYIQQGNLAGAGMEAGLPMFAGSPMPPQMGTMIPEDPRLGPMPKPNLPQLPMAPSDLPISVLPPQGMPGDFLDENAADFRRADMEWQKMATMLGLTPTGEPTRGRAPPKEPGAAPPPVEPPTIEPGGQGDQWADVGTLLGFGPAYASTIDDPEAVDVAVSSLVDGDEVLNPRGQAQPEEKPRGWTDWLTYGLLDLDGDEPQPAAPAAPAVAPGSVVGGPGGLSMGTAGAPAVEMPTTPSGRPAPGAVGDLNTSRERGAAGLAEDAEAAEEELNWINRQMRDKLGMTDASERAKAAEALVSFGSTLLASKGDTWQAIGEGLQAGLGSVTAANDEEKAALAAQQDAMLEDARWRAEFALEELRARKDAGTEGGMPKKLQEVTEYVDWLMAMDPTLTLDAAQDMAERYLGIKSQEAWSTNPYALPEEG